MRFVDQQGGVLPARHEAGFDGAGQRGRELFEVVAGSVVGRHMQLVGAHQVFAPAVEGANDDALVDAAAAQLRVDAPGQRAVVAKHQHRLVDPRRGGELLRAKDQDHRLARTRRAVDHAVAVAQAARNLLLLQIHHLQQVGQCDVGRRIRLAVEQRGLRLHANLGEQVPADAVALRQGQGVRVVHREHAPQPGLKARGVDAVGQIVAQQGA